jgi:hypothetical protein
MHPRTGSRHALVKALAAAGIAAAAVITFERFSK